MNLMGNQVFKSSITSHITSKKLNHSSEPKLEALCHIKQDLIQIMISNLMQFLHYLVELLNGQIISGHLGKIKTRWYSHLLKIIVD